MRMRRILAAVIATAALAGLGLTGAATAAAQGAPSDVTPSECEQGGGTPVLMNSTCKGGTHDGERLD
ncbi:hypothetical protein ABZ723_17270 [Streptomyces sp. NPDC006700]|uniref:hypothetical protein n=1 Tax=unclassified Streptomyces TaxID=2593676 RepID=UPI0033F39F7D